jgi:hypothetical protein
MIRYGCLNDVLAFRKVNTTRLHEFVERTREILPGSDPEALGQNIDRLQNRLVVGISDAFKPEYPHPDLEIESLHYAFAGRNPSDRNDPRTWTHAATLQFLCEAQHRWQRDLQARLNHKSALAGYAFYEALVYQFVDRFARGGAAHSERFLHTFIRREQVSPSHFLLAQLAAEMLSNLEVQRYRSSAVKPSVVQYSCIRDWPLLSAPQLSALLLRPVPRPGDYPDSDDEQQAPARRPRQRTPVGAAPLAGQKPPNVRC